MVIDNNVENLYIINKSKFITYLYKIKSKNEFNKYYKELKQIYKDATHICYAYIIDNDIKYSDDKEPGKTAGLPIYEVLKKNNLNYITCFVIRYFGGIKLGANGLVRAYSNSVSLALNKTNIRELKKIYTLKVYLTYKTINSLENIISSSNIISKNFQNEIMYQILIDEDKKKKLDDYKFNYDIVKEDYI